MQYLLLIYDAESNMKNMSREDIGAMMGEYKTFTDELQRYHWL